MPIKYQCYIDPFNFLVVKIQINDHKNELVGQVKKKKQVYLQSKIWNYKPEYGKWVPA